MRIPSVFTTNPAASPLGPPNPTPAQRGVTSAATSAARARLTRETAQTMSSGAPVVERAPLGEAELHALRRQSRTQIATTLALVERALASPSTGPAALGRAIGHVGATIGLMRTVPPGSLGDGPLHALAHFVKELRACPGAADLKAGDIVTTGTWTDAWPVASGQVWTARFSNPLEPLKVRFI